MGSGKTAVGRLLARRAGREFVDSDHEIERRTGVEIPFIFEKEGEAGFREREKEVLQTDDPRALLESLRCERQPLYEAVADYSFNTTGKRVRTVANNVARTLERDGHLTLHS